jgi:peroxiredoxin
MLGGAATFLLRTQQAPNVAFTSLDGNRFTTADLRGQVVLVNFFATSCAICVHEMPKMVETYQRYHARGLDFVAVAMQYDAPSYVVDYAQSRQLPFKVAFDAHGEAADRFGDVDATPTTFVVDKQGRIIARYVGEPDFDALDRLIEKQLNA